MTRILFVCLGNICRSPTAEAVLRAIAPKLDIDSAGTSNWNIGDPPYGPAIKAAANRGYDMSSLRARQVLPGDFNKFDLILAMDRANLSALEELQPETSSARLRLFLDYAPQAGTAEVPDPYYTRDFEGALDLIEQAAKSLKASL
ncbi:MAG: low molecular weight protein-tyrosine-phosphatase [Boseongicola sp.]